MTCVARLPPLFFRDDDLVPGFRLRMGRAGLLTARDKLAFATRARVETGKSWRNETPTFWGLFRMTLKVETKQETNSEFTFRFT